MKKPSYVCQACGQVELKWAGRCNGCGEWNTFVEEAPKRGDRKRQVGRALIPPIPVASIGPESERRMSTGIAEFDRVLGGGIVPGSLVLVSGDPGIGKSTLLLQVSGGIAQAHGKVLYVTGEESTAQVSMRARRLGVKSENVLVAAESDSGAVEDHITGIKPALAIVDSVQTMTDPGLESSPGSVAQVRESAARFMRVAKAMGIPVFLVGHVTKTGAIAGPRVLEHMVDTVVYFEGEAHHAYRLIRCVKNRYGSTDEVGIFEMFETGLVEVKNPSEMLLRERALGMAGSVVVASVEGTRPLLVEVQALVAPSPIGTPRRTTTGVDHNRAAIIVAVLDRRVGLHLAADDVYVSAAGGVSLSEPAADLGIAAAMASSFRNKAIAAGTAVFGEVGLSGELRAIPRAELRIAEALRLGFERCVIPEANLRSLQRKAGDIEVIGCSNLRKALDALFDT